MTVAPTNASSSDLTLSNLVGSETETLTLSGNGTLANANVGTNKSVTLNTLSILRWNKMVALAHANYNLTGGTHQLTVTQRVVNATGTRLYDATSNANSRDLSLGNLEWDQRQWCKRRKREHLQTRTSQAIK